MEKIPLKGGLTLPEPVIWLAVELGWKGWDLKRQGSKLLLAPARSKPEELAPRDRELIGEWKADLLQIADYLTSELSVG